MTERTRLPLPRPGPLGLIQYAGVDMHAYSDAENAALRADLTVACHQFALEEQDNDALRANAAAMQSELIRAANFELDAGRVMRHESMINGFEDLWAIEAEREALEQRIMKAEEQVRVLREALELIAAAALKAAP